MTQNYAPPVSKLMTIGEQAARTSNWPDYVATYSITREHIPELIQMIQDEDLWWAGEDSDEVWSALHAWRTLGQLNAIEAAAPLLELLEEDDDWSATEVPTVLAMFGPDVLPLMTTFLHDGRRGMWARVHVAEGFEKLYERHPEIRAQLLTALTEALDMHALNPPEVNASIVTALIKLKAVECADNMEAAFAADNVDLATNGDWEEVQIELGLLSERLTPAPEGGWIFPEHREQIAELRRLLKRRMQLDEPTINRVEAPKAIDRAESIRAKRQRRQQVNKKAKAKAKKKKRKR